MFLQYKMSPFNRGDKGITGSVLSCCRRESQWDYRGSVRSVSLCGPRLSWTSSRKTFPITMMFSYHLSWMFVETHDQFLYGDWRPRTFRLEWLCCRIIQSFSASSSKDSYVPVQWEWQQFILWDFPLNLCKLSHYAIHFKFTRWCMPIITQ